jgi:hypothetical protein
MVSYLTPVQDAYACLAAHLPQTTAQARHLTQWLYAPASPGAPVRRREILVPFYLEGEPRARLATLEMELLAGQGTYYADPVRMAFVRWNADFQMSCENACAYIRTLGWWPEDQDVCWRFKADPPLLRLEGASAGGALFAALWHLLSDTPNDLSVTISAKLSPNGRLQPVDHILLKLEAVLENLRLSDLLVAKDQEEFQVGPEGPDGRLQIWKVRHAADLARHGRRP